MYHQREFTGFELTGNFQQQIPGNVLEISQTYRVLFCFTVFNLPGPSPQPHSKNKSKIKSKIKNKEAEVNSKERERVAHGVCVCVCVFWTEKGAGWLLVVAEL